VNCKMKQNFVKTSDEETAKRLREAGFVELAKEGNRWVFVNKGQYDFSQSDMKVSFDNKLLF